MARPVSINLTPTAVDADGITTTETIVAARLSFLINGAESTGYDANGIAESQTPAAGGVQELTLDGALVTGAGSALLDPSYGQYVTIDAAGVETARTFTITGTPFPQVKGIGKGGSVSETITGPGAGLTTIGSTLFSRVTSVTVDDDTAGAVTVGVNGYATFSTPQHATYTPAADESARTFIVTGINRNGITVTDSLAGSASLVASLTNFAVVQRIDADAATAGAITWGVDGTCESNWVVLDRYGGDFNVGFSGEISAGGSLTYGVQHTFDNVFVVGEDTATAIDHVDISTETTTMDGNYTNPPFATRLQIEVYTSGTATFNVMQAASRH